MRLRADAFRAGDLAWRGCHRKKVFRSDRDARRRARQLHKDTGLPWRSYACTYCYAFHLTKGVRR